MSDTRATAMALFLADLRSRRSCQQLRHGKGAPCFLVGAFTLFGVAACDANRMVAGSVACDKSQNGVPQFPNVLQSLRNVL